MKPKKCFTESVYGLPIAGTPEPKPCPFCGNTVIEISFDSSKDAGLIAKAGCGNCGAELPPSTTDMLQDREAFEGRPDDRRFDYFDVALDAARHWNDRSA
jgi:hypothetical protein